ncbi:hypothetical protein LSAT2_022151 [Lamellibrachia satsuma]|nr:hypothetical protein LSAT2_022151 [Lamellibrachia satsuma]
MWPSAVNQTPDNSVQVRLCHLAISPDFDGYGFNLHSEKGKAGQFIGTIDPGSPAEAAGLREGDRIIEVNDVPINNDEHKHVVQKIKLIQNKTKLLVVDAETARWYKQQNIPISSTMPNIKVMGAVTSELVTENDVFTEAEMNHSSSTNQVNEVDVNSLESPEPIEASEPVEDNPEERMNGDAIVEHEANRVEDVPPPVEDIAPPVEDVAPIENHYTEEEEAPPPEPEPQAPVVTEIEPMPASPSSSQNSYTDTRSPAPVQSDSSSGGAVEGELFGMSVKEARARIGGRKKRNEVKQSGMSSKAKYDLFQKL